MPPVDIDGMELARRGAAFLYQQGASKVWIFGSVAKGRRLDFRSDIDFAVEGVSPADILRIGAQLEGLLNFSADLVEMEKTQPALRREILEGGILVPKPA
jgi:predicted nucleotidyltransferase